MINFKEGFEVRGSGLFGNLEPGQFDSLDLEHSRVKVRVLMHWDNWLKLV